MSAFLSSYSKRQWLMMIPDAKACGVTVITMGLMVGHKGRHHLITFISPFLNETSNSRWNFKCRIYRGMIYALKMICSKATTHLTKAYYQIRITIYPQNIALRNQNTVMARSKGQNTKHEKKPRLIKISNLFRKIR